ncbi:MAG: hypothetical protein IKI15_02610 [Lachnospiraceae bacterium]|nr:hypothetical protein [Lachnospiraceae bacterium]
MKRKNTGLSTVEIVVAAVILVAVVVGLLVVVKLTKNTEGPSADKETATKTVEDLLNQVDGYVRSADLEVNYDEENYIRLIGKSKTQIYHFDSASGKVYMVERNTSDFGTDEDVIRKVAKDEKPSDSSMTLVASNVKTFLVELIDKETEKGLARTTVRSEVGKESVSETKDTPLNPATIVYFAKYAGEDIVLPTNTPTPTPADTPTPVPTTAVADTPTPVPTTAAETPTPTAEPELVVVHKIQNPQTNVETIVVNTMVLYPDDAVFKVIVRRSGEETDNLTGAKIGGIGFDVGNPADGYEFVLDHDPAFEEEFYFDSYTVGELRSLADSLGIKKLFIKVNDNSGYSLVGVDIEYYK